ncbi:YjbH domain-containing protein [Luteimonas salinilitoris]|uniref:YjbH domain-containing protein n=1 Tax=Luteimonas salinilitoris TaxID=3237697 RepID=A0ABV4HMQ5_9GAMM
MSRPVLGLLALGVCAGVHGQTLSSQSDWGGVGLMQTPSARMAEPGELAFTATHTSPYSRYNVSMQPFSWLEGTFRYMNVTSLNYGPEGLSGDQHYKDKSIDVKLRLWRESRWLPEVALGIRDLGGTGLFSGEYLVASKRFGPVDVSFGAATGYLGNRGDFGNPLGALDDRFETRPSPSSSVVNAGKFGLGSMFRGRVGMFGGIAWQTPWERLELKLEYDGNDYRHEPRNIRIRQSSPINIGAVLTAHPNVQFSLGWERGNEAMVGITLRTNLDQAISMAKPLDPPAVAPRERDATAEGTAAAGARADGGSAPGFHRDAADKAHAERERNLQALAGTDWEAVADLLHDNAGFNVEQIQLRGSELLVTGAQGRYFYPAKGLGRSARILDHAAGPNVEWFTLVNTTFGMPMAEASIHRGKFADYLEGRIGLDDLTRNVELNPPSRQRRDVLYQAPLDRFDHDLALGFGQTIGGPDAFFLYQVSADYAASYFFSRSLWLSGAASANLLNNYDKFRYDAPSNLPRVRTDLRRYLTTADVTFPNLQLTGVRQLSRDVYGMAYAGMLEYMYGGVGGEVLYRPFGERWALGLEANWVKQRGFRQNASFRDYEVATGHATLYYQLGEDPRIRATVSAGRYLAGDWGATFNLARVFDNGAIMGAYFTMTDVSSEQFGEGSFDKGIYFSVPFELFLPRSTRARSTVLWNPLTRDGGARLGRKYHLYDLTDERDRSFFFENIDRIDE